MLMEGDEINEVGYVRLYSSADKNSSLGLLPGNAANTLGNHNATL